ncbi:MAG: adenine deaminase C-terminal domain-containing protein [Candidatus Limnocylindrales bacterium]
MDDLLIHGGRVVSVSTGELFAADVTVAGQTISGVLPPGTAGPARERIDASGLLVAPGFVDAHMHVESSFLVPGTFAGLALARGTTTVLADPHEIVNVAGAAGLRWLASAGRRTPMTMLVAVPSCVPSLPGFETAGAELAAADVSVLLDEPGVVALGEVMDYRAVVGGEARMTGILNAARHHGAIIDGHCPGLSGTELSRYMAAGIDSDHTKNPVPVALEKARLGMHLQLQEKGISPELIGALMALPLRPPISLVTDDVAADALVAHGHLDHVGRRAIAAGLPPLEALRAMTLVPAGRLRLHDRGSVTPGYRADLVLLPDLADLRPVLVIAGGRVVARDGVAVEPARTLEAAPFRDTVRLAPPGAAEFALRPGGADGDRRVLAIRVNPTDTSTTAARIDVEIRDGLAALPPGAATLAVFHRHGRNADRALAPVVGLALEEGAAATTYAHDSHNLLVLGSSQASMAAAAEAVISAGGGVAVARGGRVTALLRLPVGGIMSDAPGVEVAAEAGRVRQALHEWGYRHANAFMSLATLSLPVSPALKLTDRGLVDVERRAWAVADVEGTHDPTLD